MGRRQKPRVIPGAKPWQPGESGNASRPISGPQLRALAATFGQQAILTLGELLSHSKVEVRVRAAEALLDRGFGRPKSEVTIHESADPLGIAQLRSAARELLADATLRVGLREALRASGGSANGMSQNATLTLPPESGALPPDSGDAPSQEEVTICIKSSNPEDAQAVDKPVDNSPIVSDYLREWWLDILSRYPRVAIAGGPRTGKTTLSAIGDGRPVVHTDDWIDKTEWDGVPTEVIKACGAGPVIVEGVQVPRALRKGLSVDCVVWCERPRALQTRKQLIMLAGLRTIFAEWASNNAGAVPVFSPPEGA